MEDRQRALNTIADILQGWMDFNLKARKEAGVETKPSTHVITVPPHWPTFGQLENWIKVLRDE